MKNYYHSLLFVPATSKMLLNIKGQKADAIIIDLEDSILERDKCCALKKVEKFLQKYSYSKDIYVRINPDRINNEVPALNQFPIKGYMLPKTNNDKVLDLLSKLAKNKKIFALVETIKGIVNIDKIAADERISMIAFGGEDFVSESNINNSEEYLSYVKGRIVLYAKYYNKPVFDTIHINITDEYQYAESVKKSKNYGFDGKLAIHPMQVGVINELYKCEDIAYYKYVLDEYYKSGKSIIKIDNRIYEKPHIISMEKKLRKMENKADG